MKNIFLTYFLSPCIILILSLLEFTKLGPIIAPLASAPTTAGPIYLNFLLSNDNLSNLAAYSIYGMFSTIFSFTIYCHLIKKQYHFLKTIFIIALYFLINFLLLTFKDFINTIFIIFLVFLLCIYGNCIPKYELIALPKKKINIFIKVISCFLLINIVFFLKQKYENISAILSSFPVGAVSLIIPLHLLHEKKYIINFLQRYIVFSISLLTFFTILYLGNNNVLTFSIAIILSIITSVIIYFEEEIFKKHIKNIF
jgi:hypothetical protein